MRVALLFGFVVSAALGTVLSVPAHAWGKIGHRVAAHIAEEHLSGQARAGVSEILGAEDLAESSTWPDFMRSAPTEFWQKVAGPLHYVTVPTGKGYSEIGAPDEGDAYTGLARFRATLIDRDASLAERQLALRFIVHIIGDLHQPLHCGNGTDRGGNDFAVTWRGRATNLHFVWDTALVEDEALSYSEMSQWLSRRITPDDVQSWWETDPLVWIEESVRIRDTIYPDANDERARNLSWRYVFAHRATMRRRLSQAGVRMAAYLNEAFDELALPDAP
ncbi:MAG: S1/P1 nuclease [Pseudomonadota bacterium]